MADKKEASAPQILRILVIDDNRDVADSSAALLRLWGFDAKTAYSGQRALELLDDFQPNCIISDIGLPGIDGYQLAKLIRQKPEFTETPLIAVSANYDPQAVEAAGFNYHFVKPAHPLVLHDFLRKTLAMNSQLERAEKLIQKQGEVVGEVKDLIKDVKHDMKEMKQEIQEVKHDLKEIKDELRDSFNE